MSNPAEDEFNALIARNTSHIIAHPEDESSAHDNDDDEHSHTVSHISSGQNLAKSSIRSSTLNTSEDSDDDFEDRYGVYNGGLGGTGSTKNKKAFHLPSSSRVSKAQTGPKGVIADAWAAERATRAALQKDGKFARAGRRVHTSADSTLGTDPIADNLGNSLASRGDAEEDDELGEDQDENGDDDELMRKWRQLRIHELKHIQSLRPGRYGTVDVVDDLEYLEAVETAPRGTVVVVYIFDDELPISRAYGSHLSTIAAKYSNTKFVALHYEEAEMEHAGVPAVLSYKNGELFKDLVPLVDEVPFTCNVVTNLEEALKRNGII